MDGVCCRWLDMCCGAGNPLADTGVEAMVGMATTTPALKELFFARCVCSGVTIIGCRCIKLMCVTSDCGITRKVQSVWRRG